MAWTWWEVIGEVVYRLRIELGLRPYDDLYVCQGAQMIKHETLLGTLADHRGIVEVSFVCVAGDPRKLAINALERGRKYAEKGDWGAWSDACSEADHWFGIGADVYEDP